VGESYKPETAEKFYTGSWTKFKSYSPYSNLTQNPKQSQIQDAIDFSKEIISPSTLTRGKELEDGGIEYSSDLHFTKLWKIIGQVHNSYIIVETPNGIKFFDQHALAERINYEKLIIVDKVDKKISSQGLLLWESIQITPIEANFVVDNIDIFQKMWFDFEVLPGNIVLINWIPDFVKKENIKEIFLGILEDIWNSGLKKSKTLDEVKNKIFAYTACRSAIKFGNKLNLFEMNKLLNEAVETYSSTCPHWRPVVFEISLEELKGKYER
jgi:DNA mismatch repair protein MutL